VATGAVLAILTLAFGAAADEAAPHRPSIHFAGGVPGDLQALAAATWASFTDAFPARWDCVPDVTVSGAWQFAVRADYDPARRLVTIRIPGTAPNLRATLVHEFAHHLDFACPDRDTLRRRFLAAQGFPPRTPWLTGPTWVEIPSEQFAEAAVQVVLRRPPRSLVVVRPAALAAIRAWSHGR